MPARQIACTSATRIAVPTSFRFRQSGTLCRQAQSPRNLFHQFRKRQCENALARVEHDVDWRVTSRRRQTYCLAHAALDAITVHCSAEHLADRQSHPRFSCRRSFAPQEENCHVSRELPAPGLIYALKIGVFQQTPRLRKLAGVGDLTRHSVFVGCRRRPQTSRRDQRRPSQLYRQDCDRAERLTASA